MDPMTVMAIAQVGMSLLGGAAKAKAQTKAAWASMEQAATDDAQKRSEAKQIREASDLKARQIKAAALFMRGKQMANQASSGVVVGDGSAQAMVDQTIELASQDVFVELYNGARSATFAIDSGRKSGIAGMAQAGAYSAQAKSSLLNGAMDAGMAGYAEYSRLSAKSSTDSTGDA